MSLIRDSGCQPNFITRRTADELKLKVVNKNFSVVIKGFNSDGEVITNMVGIKLLEDHPPIAAICIPDIKVNINLPNLGKVVRNFNEKGFKLADEFLTGEFDLILGNNDCQILPQTEKAFGIKPYSVYAETPFGIILYGSI